MAHSSPLLVGALALFLCLTACGGGGGGEPEPPGGGPPTLPTGSIQGRIEVLSGVPGVVFEQEPNDTFDDVRLVAQLPVGGRLTIFGEVDAAGGDARDGYRLRLRPRLALRLVLKVQHPETNDVALQVFDPVAMQAVATFGAAESAQGVTVHANGDVDVVVQADAGQGAYELAVAASAPYDPIREEEPNDDAAAATYLGQVDAGETFEVQGTASVDGDPEDGVLLLVPATSRLECQLEHPAFSSYALRVDDVTAGFHAPIPLARFDGVPSGPQSGGITVAGGTLVHVAVEATAGSGPWRLRFDVHDPAPGASAPPSSSAMPATAGYLNPTREILAGEAVVRMKAGVDLSQRLAPFDARLASKGRQRMRRVLFDRLPGITPSDRRRATWSRIRALAGLPGVEWVEPNYRVHAAREPDDTYYPLQWHYELIDLPRAWDITTGDPSVIVAVVDTGQTNHPDLAGRQIAGYDLISNPAVAGDGDGIDADPTDTGDGGASGRHSWHGTHVAGTIGASTDDGRGVAGVTWATQIMHVRALGVGGGTTYDVANAILYAAGLENSSGTVPDRRADVVNLSLGSSAYSQFLADACAAARSEGVLLVAAAGNSNSSAAFYPASLASVVSVMAVDASRRRAPYSNYGPTVDLAAPGGDLGADRTADGYADGVLSTLWSSSGLPAFAFYQGTSMASPHVAGVAALLLSANGDLSPGQLEGILTSTATDLGAAGRDDTYGYGLVDAYEALLEVAAPRPPGPPVLEVSPTTLNFGQDQVEADVRIRNHGASFLQLEDVRVVTAGGDGWLSATPRGTADDTQSAQGISVRVDRTGLLTGTYRGAVEIDSNGGNARVEVVMSVATNTTPPPNLDVIVVAVDADTGQEVIRTSVNPAGSLAFTFPALPIGRYVIHAGTDLDGDGILGEDGDYVGTYPLAGQAVVLELFEGTTVRNVDFEVIFTPALDGLGR